MYKKLQQTGLFTHIFFISLFLVVPTIAFVRPPEEPFFALTKIFVQDTTASFVLLCFFYLNYYILLPKFFLTKKYFQYILYVVIFLALAFTLPFLIGTFFNGTHHDLPRNFPYEPKDNFPHPPNSPSIASFVFDEFRRHLYLFFTAFFFSFLLRTREYLSQVKQEKLEAELSSLKAQINPHFLFNTLNSIYALSVKKDDRASEAIINLSGLMRYVIKDANGYKIALKKEIEYISNYIELQKARLGNTATINFECIGEPGSKDITPLILITYIENAFKYGVNPDVDDCVIGIKIDITVEGIQMQVSNKKVQRSAQLESTGIGIKNTAERLKHLYPNKHVVQINENENTYSVMLSIELI
jgi:Histidine kinase